MDVVSVARLPGDRGAASEEGEKEMKFLGDTALEAMIAALEAVRAECLERLGRKNTTRLPGQKSFILSINPSVGRGPE
jgi:hypothetical protein